MNDDELQQELRAFIAPAAGEQARERARHRAMIAFSQTAAGVEPMAASDPGERRRTSARDVLRGLAWAGLTPAVALVLLWWLLPTQPHQPANATVLAQVEALFPGQLDAVIEHEGGEMRVALATEAQPASDQPLLVEFRRGDEMVRVLSYSGRHVCVDLHGRQACFDALIGDHGEVIVAGEDFVWTAQNHASARGWQITAAPLGGAS